MSKYKHRKTLIGSIADERVREHKFGGGAGARRKGQTSIEGSVTKVYRSLTTHQGGKNKDERRNCRNDSLQTLGKGRAGCRYSTSV